MSSVLLVGAGHLGSALLTGWRNGYDGTFTVADKDKRPESVTPDTIVVIAVKPKDVCAAYEGIAPLLHDGQRVVSVAAGITLEKLQSLDSSKVWMRAMPSLAAAQRQSVTALLNADDEVFNLFGHLGQTLDVDDDRALDFVMMLAASGPGVMAWQAQAWQDALDDTGMDGETARRIVAGMMRSSAALLEQADDFGALAAGVATKGGITEAMINEFAQAKLDETIVKALQAALKKVADIDASF